MLTDAMTDLVTEVRSGATVETAAAEIAADYGLNPALLLRKFAEAYPVGLPSVLDAAELAELDRRLQAARDAQNAEELAAIAEFAAMRRRQRPKPDAFDLLLRAFLREVTR